MQCEIKDNTNDSSPAENLSTIKKITTNISYDEFFTKYMQPNIPCIIKNVSATWPANDHWIQNNNPNCCYLSEKYGQFEVTVSDCNEKHFNAQKTGAMTFSEYLNYFERRNNKSDNQSLYMKDCHLKKLSGDNFYTVPIYFASDWLNEYFVEKTDDDYQFVYMGPEGTWTPFHVDVFTSFSWSTNVCGRKKWYLFPPGEETKLFDPLGNLPYDITKVQHNAKCLEVIQDAGDAIFVPSGWHHQVINEKNTISINHNWVNGCNIEKMWLSLAESLRKVKREIEDCKDMDDWTNHCQLMLKTFHGIDFQMFYDLLHYIASKRIRFLVDDIEIVQFNVWKLGQRHALFDLNKIKYVLNEFMHHEDFIDLNVHKNVNSPLNLLNDITDTISHIK